MSDYKPGKIVEIKNEGRAKLVERLETYPTTKKWALVRWRIHFLDREGNAVKDDYWRPIEEIGVPNEHYPDIVDYSVYWNVKPENAPEEIDEETGEVKKKRKRRTKAEMIADKLKKREENKTGKRGRPEGEMTEIKARNIIRAVKKKKAVDKAKLGKATAYIKDLGDLKFINKYQKFTDINLNALDE
jgi:hypothetical protein